jgi:hypothetical protein
MQALEDSEPYLIKKVAWMLLEGKIKIGAETKLALFPNAWA